MTYGVDFSEADGVLNDVMLLTRAEATLETQLQLERRAFVECVATADFAEGLKAFVERRPAVFVGR